jgi:hypothetical protein
MKLTGETRSTRRKTCPSATFSTTNPTWTDPGSNPGLRGEKDEVLHTVKEGRNFLHTINRMKANWIGHILRRNCLLKHVIEGCVQGKKIRGRRLKQLLEDVKERKNCWNLKEEAFNGILWKTLALEEAMDLSQDKIRVCNA